MWNCETFTSTRCPLSVMNIRTQFYLKVYKRYEKGLLPDNGTWLDQPYKISQAIDIVDSEVSRINQQVSKDGRKK